MAYFQYLKDSSTVGISIKKEISFLQCFPQCTAISSSVRRMLQRFKGLVVSLSRSDSLEFEPSEWEEEKTDKDNSDGMFKLLLNRQFFRFRNKCSHVYVSETKSCEIPVLRHSDIATKLGKSLKIRKLLIQILKRTSTNLRFCCSYLIVRNREKLMIEIICAVLVGILFITDFFHRRWRCDYIVQGSTVNSAQYE